MSTNYGLASNGSSATATNNIGGFEPSKAIDGNGGTYFHSLTQSSANELIIDLSTTRNIDGVKLTATRTDSGYDFTFEVWTSPDNSTWTKQVNSSAASGSPSLQSFTAVNCRYVKIACTNAKYMTVTELEIWGNPPDTTPPSQVGGTPTATVISNSQINLDWADATDNVAVTDYYLERATDSGFTTNVVHGDIASSTSAKNVTGLSPNTTYYWRVKAKDAAGNYSASWSATVSATTWAAAPTITETSPLQTAELGVAYSKAIAISGGDGSVTLSLKAGSSFPSGFSFSGNLIVNSNPSALFTNAAFTLVATDTKGQTGEKAFLLSCADTTPPAKVTGVINTVVSNSRIDVDADLATDLGGIASYDTRIADDSGMTTNVHSYNYATKKYSIVSNLAPSNTKTYWTQKRAIDNSGNVGAWSDAVSATITVALAFVTNSPLTTKMVGDVITNLFSVSGGSGSGVFSLVSGILPGGFDISSNGGTLTESGSFSFTVRFTDSLGATVDKAFTWQINAVPPFYNGFEKLQIIPCLSAKRSIGFQRFKHQLGDGFRKQSLFGSTTGLKKWALTYKTLANVGNENVEVNGALLSPAEYIWDFYCRKQVSGEPFIMTDPRNGQYYLADFADESFSYERLAVQLWTTGININQVRQDNDFVFNPLLFGEILEYKGDNLSLSDNASVSSWTESNGGASLSATGGVSFQTNEQFGLPIIRLNGTDGLLSLSGAKTIYHGFILLKVTESTFGGNDGIFGDASINILSGVSGQTKFNTGDEAPMNQFGIVWFTIEGGQSLTNLQIGKKQAVSGTFLKADIAHIVLGLEQKSETECLEMVEYIATKWNCFKVFKANL